MNGFKITAFFFSSIIALFFLYPLLVLLWLGTPMAISAFKISSFIGGLEVTILMATIASLFATLVGLPLAYVLARFKFKFKEVLNSLIDIPISIPHIVVGIMIVLAFASSYGLGPYLKSLGLSVIDTLLGATIAVAYLSSTYAIRVIETAITGIPEDVELAARSLGASQIYVMRKIIIPKIWKSIVNGALLTWARSVSEAGALFIVAYYIAFGKNLYTPASIYIYESYVGIGLINAVKFSAALVITVFAIFLPIKALITMGSKS